MNNKVSILCPIYGVEKYIETCVRSLFEQTYQNIEYIFVNDCTTDRSLEILDQLILEYPERKNHIKIIHHLKNRGLSAARNSAVSNMTGDYLLHVDSDDYLAINAIEKLVTKIESTKANVVIFSSYSVFENKTIRNHVYVEDKKEYIKKLLTNSIPASMWNKFYDASFYKKIGILSIEGINQGEDYAVVPRILHHASNILWYDEPLYYYNLTNINSYSKNISINSIMSQKKADDILFDFFKNDIQYKDIINLIHIRSLLFLIKTCRKENYYKVLDIYQNISIPYSSLSLSDKFILQLLKRKQFFLCYYLILFYNKIR